MPYAHGDAKNCFFQESDAGETVFFAKKVLKRTRLWNSKMGTEAHFYSLSAKFELRLPLACEGIQAGFILV